MDRSLLLSFIALLGLGVLSERVEALTVIVVDSSFQTIVFPANDDGLLVVDQHVQGVEVFGAGGSGFKVDILVSENITFEGSTLVDANLHASNGTQLRRTMFQPSNVFSSILLEDGVRFDESTVSNASISAGVGSDLSDGIFEFVELNGDFTGVDMRSSYFFGADLSGITGFDTALWSGVSVDPTTVFGGNLALQSLVTVDPGLTASTTPIPEPGTALLMVLGLSGLATGYRGAAKPRL